MKKWSIIALIIGILGVPVFKYGDIHDVELVTKVGYGMFVLGFLSFVVLMLLNNRKENTEKETSEKTASNEEAFYNKCKSYSITDFSLSSPKDLARAKVLADSCEIKYTSDDELKSILVRIDEKERQLMQDQKEEAERQLIQEEMQTVEEYSLYSDLSAKEKRIKTLNDRYEHWMQESIRLRNEGYALDNAKAAEKYLVGKDSSYKEKNSFAMGGLAEGLGGTGLGVATFLKTEADNAQKRADKQARLDEIDAFYSKIQPLVAEKNKEKLQRSFEYRQWADIKKRKLEKAYELLELPIDTVTLNDYIVFSNISAERIMRDVLEVSVDAKAIKPLFVYDIPADCDGTINANVFINGEAYGQCKMVIDAESPINEDRIVTLGGVIFKENSKDYQLPKDAIITATFESSTAYFIEKQ